MEVNSEITEPTLVDSSEEKIVNTEQISHVLEEEEKQERHELKKAARLEQLRIAREKKKAKIAEKQAEDREIRQALIDLKRERDMAKAKKVEVEKVIVETVPVEKGPVTVTRQPEKVDDGFEEVPPSFFNQLLKSAAVGSLGLASWYLQNRTFKESVPVKKQDKGLELKFNKSNEKKPKVVQRSNDIFAQNKRPKKKVGNSGFSM